MEYLKKQYFDKSYKSLDEYLNSNKRGEEEILIVYTFSKIEDSINLTKKESYMEKIVSDIKTASKFKHILKDFYEKDKKILGLKFNSENTMFINFFISEINHFKESNEKKEDKKFIFIINIKRLFNLEHNKKITTILIEDKNINQLFIDNINGSKLSIKEIEGKNIYEIGNGLLDLNKNIIDGMLNFYRNHINERMGKYKGISYNNFIIEFENFIKNNSEMMKKIKEIIAKHIDKSEKIIDLLIKDKFLDLNTIDFVSTILNYIIDIFNKKLEIILSKSESNNFFVTDFMLHIENKEKSELNDNISNSQLTSYSFNISDEQLLKNNIFIEIRRKYFDFLCNLKEDKD